MGRPTDISWTLKNVHVMIDREKLVSHSRLCEVKSRGLNALVIPPLDPGWKTSASQGTWPPQLVGHVSLGLEIVGSIPTLGVEIS